jgi:hypothetical protein
MSAESEQGPAMTSAICPSCGVEMNLARRMPYTPYRGTIFCPACSWTYRLPFFRMRFFCAGLFVVLEFAFQVWRAKVKPSGPDLFPFALLTVWPIMEFLKDLSIVLPVSSWAKRSPAVISRAPDAFTKLIPPASESAGLLLSVLQLPRPRPVAWTWRAWINTASLVLLADISIAYAYEFIRAGNDGAFVGLILLLHLVVFGVLVLGPLILTQLSVGSVVRTGDATVGRVIWQIPGNHVFYAFVDQKNRPFVGRGNPWWGKVAGGEPVVVLYDPADPNWSAAVPYCRYRLRQPSRKTEGPPRLRESDSA